MGKFQDLMLLNYYEGWFSGAIDNEYGIADAVEFYFGWLTGLANEYDIPADYDETPDGCDALHDDIKSYLLEHIAYVDVSDIADGVLYTIENKYDHTHVYEMDILTIANHETVVSDMMYKIYDYCIKEVSKKYKVV